MNDSQNELIEITVKPGVCGNGVGLSVPQEYGHGSRVAFGSHV
jgi:hypothetical protein